MSLSALLAAAWLAGTPRRAAAAALAMAAGVVLLTPVTWRHEWRASVPVFATAYLSGETGSLFPPFPWSGYVFLGAAFGLWRPRGLLVFDWRTGGRPALAAGLAMLAAGVLAHQVPLEPYGPINFWLVSPNLFLVRAGSVLLILAVILRLTMNRRTLSPLVTALSRESLTVYLLHLGVLYGSTWNRGLNQVVGPSLDLSRAALWIAGLEGAMWLAAWRWYEFKRQHRQAARLIRIGLAAAVVYGLV